MRFPIPVLAALAALCLCMIFMTSNVTAAPAACAPAACAPAACTPACVGEVAVCRVHPVARLVVAPVKVLKSVRENHLNRVECRVQARQERRCASCTPAACKPAVCTPAACAPACKVPAACTPACAAPCGKERCRATPVRNAVLLLPHPVINFVRDRRQCD